jgi:uncharacterized protein (DUF983 family)
MTEELSDQFCFQSVDCLTFSQALTRGMTLRCPACGKGELFRRVFTMNEFCKRCGFSFQRPPGYFLGSTYINYGVTAGLTTVAYVSLYFGVGIEKQTLLPAILGFCLVFPLVFFRFARSLWLSLDCLFDRVGAEEAMSGARLEQSGPLVENNGD